MSTKLRITVAAGCCAQSSCCGHGAGRAFSSGSAPGRGFDPAASDGVCYYHDAVLASTDQGSRDPSSPCREADLTALLESRRVILCVGCGGVGKTTTCAALGLAAARLGKRALCLTIDPAKRLAQSLGLTELKTEAQRIDPAVFQAAGLDVEGSLTVMMLDTKSTFDALVTDLAQTEEKRQRILDNVMYQYIATSLAGTQEYMAMEKLYSVKQSPEYDLILLDTPPTSHALDFLDAPERLVSAIDSPAVRWFLKAFQASGKLSFDLLARSAASILRGMGKIIGGGFLEQIAQFVTEINDLFGGWRARADEVATALRGPEVAYVLVTTPDRMCIREVLFFADRLEQQGMQPDAYVVNRVHPFVHDAPTGLPLEQIGQALAEADLELGEGGAAVVAEAALQEQRRARLDRLHMVALEEIDDGDADSVGRTPLVACVPDFPQDIHDVERLAQVAERLAPPGGPAGS
ncbi:MAG: ArsA family ATPase [Deltaproteobacteria bacterium]|jgi:anion-transporting  ArsA/GET3 family ATPase|nr:ArsA family ATPase [Deltaproteobacteria bacterium]MBW2532140.1 ArsA family ATPase [Deltaproteobacteria bacterium]